MPPKLGKILVRFCRRLKRVPVSSSTAPLPTYGQLRPALHCTCEPGTSGDTHLEALSNAPPITSSPSRPGPRKPVPRYERALAKADALNQDYLIRSIAHMLTTIAKDCDEKSRISSCSALSPTTNYLRRVVHGAKIPNGFFVILIMYVDRLAAIYANGYWSNYSDAIALISDVVTAFILAGLAFADSQHRMYGQT